MSVTAVTRTAAVAAIVSLVAACTGSTPHRVPASPATGTSAGCGVIYTSGARLPSWGANAGLPPDVPFAVSREANVIAVLFGYPLRAGNRTDGRNNKVLWQMREPRDGKPLRLTARPLSGGQPVTLVREADSGSGEIYPSIVDVPVAGCWHMSLEWNGHTATIDLPYGE